MRPRRGHRDFRRQPSTQDTGMSPASVTLASALQARAEALSEAEIWSLLFLAAERLLEDLREGSSDYVVCPWSTLLSVFGSLSFQGRVSHVEAAPFRAPELLQPRSSDEPPDAAQMHVYSLGATLCWSAGFRVPASQPLQLREPLHSVLLSMCEDQPGRRRPLCSVLDACWLHREAAAHPVSANLHVRQLVGMVLGTISEVSVVSGRSTEAQSSLEPGAGTSTHRGYNLCVNSAPPAGAPQDFPEGRRPRSAPTLSAGAHDSWPDTPSPKRFLQRKGKFSRPEFVLLAAEAPVTLHLPGAIVTKKGKSCWTLRDLCVVLLSGQNLEVKCDITSTVGAVFDAVTSFANLAEITYFGLAYMTGKEFFFLDNKTRLCKISPNGWGEQPQKTSSRSFTLFLRVKFFVSHHGLLRQSQTRHQLYLQLRKDVLEEKLYCSDETQLRLGVLALQAEFGSYPETVGTQAYFRVEDYVPASLIEKMSALGVQHQVSAMHRLSPVLGREDAELEFLRVTQQLPEYGVLVHRVLAEKERPAGDMALGICAKGLIVYEVKNGSRIATLRFQWREIGKISTYRKKFTITSSITGKKHTFVTDSAKTCKYLLGLCSAQHGFNARMNAPRLASDYDKHVQMASWSLAHLAQSKPLTRTQRLSCSENALPAWRLEDPAGGLLGTSLDSVAVDTRSDTGAPDIGGSPNTGREQLESVCSVQKPMPRDPLSGLPVGSVCTVLGSQNKRTDFTAELDREIVHVTLTRDPRRGFGFVINEGEDVGTADPGIFISSILPGGPAEKAKTIKPGGQILALNHISLEGFPFDMAVRMIQNSPDSIELIISQPKGVGGDTPSEEKNSAANSGVFSPDSLSEGHGGSCSSHTQDQRRSTEEMETTGTQGSLSRWTPRPRTLPLKDAGSSCPPSLSETNASGIYFVELVKEGGTLGFSVTGGIDTSVLCGGIYVKSIVPGGPAAKEGQVLRGDRLLQVDGRSLCGLTHKQAVQCLKGSGQVARLVLERRGPRTAQPCPCVNDRMGVECTAVSLATASPDRPASCASATDGAKFEVKLRKNAGGLGFSFVQTERDSCSHLKSDLVRIKRLFPGQPAEESGAIAAGDVILAVNGKPTEGLVFQEVLHLLRGPSPEVTLLLCRPPPGVLPELGQGWQTPVTDQDLARASGTDSGQSPSWEPEGSRRDSASPDAGGGLDPGPEAFRQATGEAQWDQDRKRPWASSLRRPGDPHPHVCGLHREAEATALEKDVRRNCYSVGDIRRLDSPKLDEDDEEGDTSHPPKVPSPAVEDEVFLPINYPSGDQLPCGKCLEADSGAIPLPQSCSSGALSESLPSEGPHGSESEWEDLEEIVDPDAGALR